MIEVKNVSKTFGCETVLSPVSFFIPDRTIAVIFGRSGSGKTTLLRLLAGLDHPDTGTIAINGRVVDNTTFHEHPSRRGIGMMFQTPALWPHLTVGEHIRYVLARSPPDDREEEVARLLELTGLSALKDRYPSEISGGQARRTALARALAGQPQCLLLDEPLINLDPDLKESLSRLIREMIHGSGACAVYVTHDRAEAVSVGDIFFQLEGGSITPVSRELLEDRIRSSPHGNMRRSP